MIQLVGLLKCDRLIRGAETVEGGTWTDEEGGGWQGSVWEDDFCPVTSCYGSSLLPV